MLEFGKALLSPYTSIPVAWKRWPVFCVFVCILGLVLGMLLASCAGSLPPGDYGFAVAPLPPTPVFERPDNAPPWLFSAAPSGPGPVQQSPSGYDLERAAPGAFIDLR